MFSHEQLNRLLLSSSDPEDKKSLEPNPSVSLGSEEPGTRESEASPNLTNHPRRIAILRFAMKRVDGRATDLL
jgi:hypothetical protein